MNSKLTAISEMRKASEDFINKKITYEVFSKIMSPFLGGVFDPLEDEIEELNTTQKKEVEFYSKYNGGEFGEYDMLLPNYNNIDSIESYRKTYEKEFNKIKKV